MHPDARQKGCKVKEKIYESAKASQKSLRVTMSKLLTVYEENKSQTRATASNNVCKIALG